MLDQLVQLDRELFFLINGKWHAGFWDWLMPLLREPLFWVPVYLFLVVFFLKQHRLKGFAIIAFLLVAVGLADFISASMIKPAVQRLRPCNDLDLAGQVRLLVDCGSGFSFISSHATNHFALSFFLINLYYKQWKWILPIGFLWAFSVSYAQVYVGVHYPIDVLTGALAGTLIGWMAAQLEKRVYPVING